MKKLTGTLLMVAVFVGSTAAVAAAKDRAAPPNDHSTNAFAVESLPFSATVDLRGATLQPDEARPSCSPIRGSVWYSLPLADKGTVIAEVSSTFASALAVYELSPEGVAQEVACGSAQAGPALEFAGTEGRTYLMQLSSTGKRQGIADFGLRMSSWRDVSLYDQTFEKKVEEQNIPLLHVKGRPRPSDPAMYDVSIWAWQQPQPITVGILTFGLVTREFEAQLAKIPAVATHVRVQISGRYDSSQYRCAVDDGAGNCYVGSPLRDLNWLTGGDASRAELVVTVSAAVNEHVLVERTQVIPYAGQVLGLIP